MSIFQSLRSLTFLPTRMLLRLGTSLLFIVLLSAQSSRTVCAADSHVPAVQNCDLAKGPCSKKIGGAYVILDIEPKPVKAMKELTFTVTLKGTKAYDSLRLALQMPGMYMGNNDVRLVKTGDGKYTGTGVIPKCHSGNKLWDATVTIPGLSPPETSFLFNVLY